MAFGDSHINDFDTASGTMPCLFQVRNAALLQQSDGTNTLFSSNPTGDRLFGWDRMKNSGFGR